MVIAEKIQQVVQRLPPSFQAEVLDFTEYLLAKTERQLVRDEDVGWSSMSLELAMRGMEDEDVPAYTLSDLKVVFS